MAAGGALRQAIVVRPPLPSVQSTYLSCGTSPGERKSRTDGRKNCAASRP